MLSESRQQPQSSTHQAGHHSLIGRPIHCVKGLATLGVVAIHARVFEGTYLFKHLVNRSVGVFVCLFGLSSERWWRDRLRQTTSNNQTCNLKQPNERPKLTGGGGDLLLPWYRGRLGRLAPRWWAALILWHISGSAYRARQLLRLVTSKPEPWTSRVGQIVGYAPLLGTSWFVTEVLLLICLFPALKALISEKYSTAAAVLTACGFFQGFLSEDVKAIGAGTDGSSLQNLEFAFRLGALHSPKMLSPLRFIGRVACGAWLCSESHDGSGVISTLRLLALCVPAFWGSVAVVVQSRGPRDLNGTAPHLIATLDAVDAPLTAVLLSISHCLINAAAHKPPILPTLLAILCAIGRRSFGIYLGHVILHDAVFYHLRFTDPLRRASPQAMAFSLLGAGLVFEETIRAILDRLPRRLGEPERDSGQSASHVRSPFL